MKKTAWLIPLSILLYACPFESSVPMEAGPKEPVDSSLLGYWYGIVKDGSDFFGIEALDIQKKLILLIQLPGMEKRSRVILFYLILPILPGTLP